jgi:hypothetical protein
MEPHFIHTEIRAHSLHSSNIGIEKYDPYRLLFSILRLSFQVVFWTFLITYGEIKVTLVLYTPKEEDGGFYRAFMSSRNLLPSHDVEHSITRDYFITLYEMQGRKV